MITKITEHNGILIIFTENPKETADFLPAGGSRLGCVLSNTQDNLGISKEAAELLKKIPQSGDDIGDVMAFKSEGQDCFGWLGSPCKLIAPKYAEGDKNYDLSLIQYQTIENRSPEDAMSAIDNV